MKLFAGALSLLFFSIAAQASSPGPLMPGYNDMYNLQFASAHRFFQAWETAHPDDPMGPASDAAASLFGEFARLKILQSDLFVNNNNFLSRGRADIDPTFAAAFNAAIDKSTSLANARLKTSPNDQNALMAVVFRAGLRADYMALLEKKLLSSLDEVKQGRTTAERLLQICPTCYDAYLAIGLENYLLSLKPAPVRWILHFRGAQTDKELGLTNMTIAAQKGEYLQPYAQLLLAVAALRDEDKTKARGILDDLTKRYPSNPLYLAELRKVR